MALKWHKNGTWEAEFQNFCNILLFNVLQGIFYGQKVRFQTLYEKMPYFHFLPFLFFRNRALFK